MRRNSRETFCWCYQSGRLDQGECLDHAEFKLRFHIDTV
jgi:hypothetical protein